MCKDCGCSINNQDHHHHNHENIHTNPQLNDTKTISIVTKILDQNNIEAGRIREHFNQNKVVSINLMSSPGAGKTSLLEELVSKISLKFCVIEGDLETSKDADRLIAKNIPAIQIQTGSACHLDAFMVHKALHQLPIEEMDVCFIENVGNLVCPAAYDVGSHFNIVLLSVPEGDDKIEKYPVMFRSADLILITKTDLLPYFDFVLDDSRKAANNLKPNVDILEISTKDDQSIDNVVEWIKSKKSELFK